MGVGAALVVPKLQVPGDLALVTLERAECGHGVGTSIPMTEAV